jgi:thioredoxin reductase
LRIAILGAGPAGLEAGLLAAEGGHDFTIFERDVVGASLLDWGTTRFFSPLRMNVSPRAMAVLGAKLPAPETLPTGPEFVAAVLRPLADSPPLHGRIREGARVLGVARKQMLRRDYPGHPLRGEKPFVLHLQGSGGREEHVVADAVIDATGVHATPNPSGRDGLRAVGENAAASNIVRTLGELHRRKCALAGTDVVLVGHGHSAANALDVLLAIEPRPRVAWVFRSASRRPVVTVVPDTLEERERIVNRANDAACVPPPLVHVIRNAQIEGIEPHDGRLLVRLSSGPVLFADTIVSMTGYRGDLSFLSELALDIAPDTEGPRRLSRAVSQAKDCLSRPLVTDADLQTGEPNFFFAGHKSYGRLSSFLLSSGVDQLERMFASLGNART